MNIEEEYNDIEQFEDGSGPAEEIMLQRHYAKMADEAIEDAKQYDSPDDDITPWDLVDV